MTRIVCVNAQDFDPQQATFNHGDPGTVWVHVRPDLRRSAAIAADLLTALGKDLTWHGKGRNEESDRNLAQAWVQAQGIHDIVLSNAQHAPEGALRYLLSLAHDCGTTIWLLHRSPITDAHLCLLQSLCTETAQTANIPPPYTAPSSPRDPIANFPVPTADFLHFAHIIRDHDNWREAGTTFRSQHNITHAKLANTPTIDTTCDEIMRVLFQASATCELVTRLRACQLAAWKVGIHVGINFDVLLSHQERPSTQPHRLDRQLMSYRQPQRIVTSSLTIRGMPLDDIRRITVHEALADPKLESIIDDASDDLATAWQALINLRLLEGAKPIEALLPQSERTLASFVTQATADSGINIAGRRVERTRSPIRWLSQLGIAVRSLQ